MKKKKALAEVTAGWNKIPKIIIQHNFKKFLINSPLDRKEDNTMWTNRGIDSSEMKSGLQM